MELLTLFSILSFVYLFAYLPGRVILEFLPLEIDQKFAGSFGCSFLLYFIIGFTGYVFQFDAYRLHAVLFSGIILMSLYIFIKRYIFKPIELYFFLVCFIFLLVMVSLQGLLPNYSGGYWYFDWWEHYQRTLFFLYRYPLDHKFLHYFLTERPPLFNVVAYVFQSVISGEYWVYQIIATLLNTVVILPCYLFIKKAINTTSSIRLMLVTIAVLFLNFNFIQQATYTWTKSLCTYFLLMGVYFYLEGRKKGNRLMFLITAFFLSGALLTHYSALIYILIIFADLLIFTIIKRGKYVKSLIITSTIFLATVSIWFGWSAKHYGLPQTLFPNTAFEWQKNITFEARIRKDMYNLVNILAPRLTDNYSKMISKQTSQTLVFYDMIIGIYPPTLPGNITISFSIMLMIIILEKIIISTHSLLSRIRDNRRLVDIENISKSVFWKNRFQQRMNELYENPTFFLGVFMTLSLFIGITAIAYPNPTGDAHIICFPLSLLIICFCIILLFQLRNKWKFLTGIILFLYIIESLFTVGSKLLVLRTDLHPRKVAESLIYPEKYVIQATHISNYLLKRDYSVVFLYDEFSVLQPVFLITVFTAWLLCIRILIGNLLLRQKRR